ncbi:hypothetical protein OG772_31265 [Streptomyces sp. NBC_01321]|nr:hypothetical protein OG772_31265 [Streptomyces sp. NBC_01321]WSU25514.1 hypothetical protein OG508_34310 [Streptomyces sp. NBC_01108]
MVVVVLIAATLLVLANRQDRANERNEQQALRRVASQARSYAGDMLDEAKDHHPSEVRTRGIAQQHDGTLLSYTPSDDSLTTIVQFFETYEETSMFGSSYSRTYRCYSFLFQADTEGGTQKGMTPLQKCPVA